jgi:hypothetical protein
MFIISSDGAGSDVVESEPAEEHETQPSVELWIPQDEGQVNSGE